MEDPRTLIGESVITYAVGVGVWRVSIRHCICLACHSVMQYHLNWRHNE